MSNLENRLALNFLTKHKLKIISSVLDSFSATIYPNALYPFTLISDILTSNVTYSMRLVKITVIDYWSISVNILLKII